MQDENKSRWIIFYTLNADAKAYLLFEQMYKKVYFSRKYYIKNTFWLMNHGSLKSIKDVSNVCGRVRSPFTEPIINGIDIIWAVGNSRALASLLRNVSGHHCETRRRHWEAVDGFEEVFVDLVFLKFNYPIVTSVLLLINYYNWRQNFNIYVCSTKLN